MKTQTISLTALITLLSATSAPFAPNFPALLLTPAALSQPSPSSENGDEVCRSRSQAMLPLVEYNNQVLVNRLAYGSQSPKRGDIIVFKPNQAMLQEYILSEPAYPVSLSGTYLMRRVIGLPGERVAVVGGQVYVNDQPLQETYTKEQANYILRQVTIPANSYFVLGDNRNNSSDSHSWGFVTQDLLAGQFVRVVEVNRRRSQIEKTRLVGQTQLKSTKLAQTETTQVCKLY